MRYVLCTRWLALSGILGAFAIAPAILQAQPAIPEVGNLLSSYRFDDTNWLTAQGYPPRGWTNVQTVPTWYTNAMRITGSGPAYLNYKCIETNWTNITVSRGCLMFWCRPRWSGTNLGGSGPGTSARLFDIGTYTTNASIGWWSLHLNSQGTRIYFGGQTNGQTGLYLDAPIQWISNTWHMVALNYSTTNSTLFLDGVAAITNGLGAIYWPSASILSNGFFIGSDSTGSNLAKADFESMRIYDGLMPDSLLTSFYESTRARIDAWEGAGGGGGNSFMAGGGDDWGLFDGASGGELLSADAGCPSASFNYSNKMWLDIVVCPTTATLTLHNTGPDTNYMFFSRTNVASGLWTFETETPGEIGSTTVTVTVPLNGRPNLFFAGGDGSDPDGDGLPSVYESLVTGTDPYDGDTGDTGIPDGFKDPDGDGWTNIDEFRKRQNPGAFNSPPPLTGVFRYVSTNNLNVIEWSPPAATPISFTIERKNGTTWQAVATVAGAETSFTDTNLTTAAEYRVRANYPAASTPFVSTEPTSGSDPLNTVPATIVNGPGGALHVLSSQVPDWLDGFLITRQSQPNFLPKDSLPTPNTNSIRGNFYATTNAITGFLPGSAATSGIVRLSTNFVPSYGYYSMQTYALGKDGLIGNPTGGGLLSYFDAMPFLDGRQHMLDNLNFVTRAANTNRQLEFWFSDFVNGVAGTAYGSAPAYAVAGFHWRLNGGQNTIGLYDRFQPFSDSSVLRAFAYESARFDSYGNPFNAGYDSSAAFPILRTTDSFFSSLYFNAYTYAASANTNVPSRSLTSAASQYIFQRRGTDAENMPDIGLTWDSELAGWRMASGARNYHGLQIQSVRCVKITDTPQSLIVYTVQPGGLLPRLGTATNAASGWFYTEAEAPTFAHAGFYFTPGLVTADGPSPLYGPSFPSPPWWLGPGIDRTNQFMIGHGKPFALWVWARKTLANGYSGRSFYLQHYLDKAYKMSAAGTVTTNETGILSEYGEFFPTEPGRVALVTKPDLTGGPTATAIVHVVRLQLDVNHDGIMDGRFQGPDNTSAGKPFVFWWNNDYDRGNTVDGNDFEEDDLAASDRDLNPRKPDYDLTSQFLGPSIASRRDLEDYARLWTTGITNVLAGLPTNAVVELAWRTTSSSNPTLRLFRAAADDGSAAYLTSTNAADQQMGAFLYLGVVSPTNALQLNGPSAFANKTESYLFCGAARGNGELVLRVRIAATNIVETSAFVQIKEIKEMYERWTCGDSPSAIPTSNVLPVSGDLPADVATAFLYPYSPARDTNTAYVLFVHGWNLEQWEKDRFAETAYKRLYWQGYQGRFGSFRWPTRFKFGSKNGGVSDYWDAAIYPTHYDASEFNAWRSGEALRRLLARLNRRHPGRVHLLAHSMGNVVAGEALRLAGTTRLVNTYVASQAAITAHVYDGTLTGAGNLLNFVYDHPSPLIPSQTYGPDTPNIYSNFLAGTSSAAARRVNFYNANDYALAADKWQWDQLLKPDRSSRLYFFDGYPYDDHAEYHPGSPDDDPPWDHFKYEGLLGFVSLPIAQNRYEIMSFAAEPRAKALGVVPVGVFLGNLNLADVWLADTQDPPASAYSRHKWHSAQFRSTIMRQRGYWQALLGPAAFGVLIP